MATRTTVSSNNFNNVKVIPVDWSEKLSELQQSVWTACCEDSAHGQVTVCRTCGS